MHTHASVTRRQQTFGYTEEELRILLTPMARTGAEPLGSMGTDTPIAVLSDRPRLLFDYFSQLFAQVTNPPLDAIREELVTSLAGTHRPGGATCSTPTPAHCRQVVLPFPVIDNDELAKIRAHQRRRRPARLRHARRLAACTAVDGGGAALRRAARRDLRRGVRGDRRRRAASSCCPTATPTPSWRRSRRCCSPPRCTTTWSARRPAPRSAWSSRPATCARCTTSRCSSATAPPRSTRTSRWRPSRTSPATATASTSSPSRRCATWSRRSARAC